MCDATEGDHSYFFVRLKTSPPPPEKRDKLSKGEEPLFNTFKLFKVLQTKFLSSGEDLGEASSYVKISFLLKNHTAPPNKTPMCASKIYRLFLIAGQFSILPFMGTLSSSIAM